MFVLFKITRNKSNEPFEETKEFIGIYTTATKVVTEIGISAMWSQINDGDVISWEIVYSEPDTGDRIDQSVDDICLWLDQDKGEKRYES